MVAILIHFVHLGLNKGVWDVSQFKWVVDEAINQQYIEQLKQDKTSNPPQKIDCSFWERKD